MNRHIFKFCVIGITALLPVACNDSENDLLEPKVYFENKENTFAIEDDHETMTFDLASRLSAMTASQVDVSYSIAEPSVVDEYNTKNGTSYEMFDPSQVKLSSATSVIPGGKLYADKVTMELTGLDAVEEGKSFILPVRVRSTSVSALPDTSIAFFILSKPIKILNVGTFSGNYVSVRFPAGTYFTSFTYETLIYLNSISNNNTVMGTEGVMILRIGDAPGTPKDYLEVAGRQHYNVSEGLKTGRWYHVALTYDQPSGKTGLYVNGAKWAESAWAIPGFDPNSDVGFNIGMLPGFQWGTRPLRGYLSETRVWSVARTENQLKQNMLGVDPNSEGLALYYKFNGTDVQQGGTIMDATGRINGTTNGIRIHTLATPVVVE
ncbi:DUF1735 and LamG domain-containing protein [Bacteroides congonensis]|uniref:DUF1735 and LamG domain-containing protein n=1 Tax=Bacteroides congonensis TaxID=1871006 RepID=UPI0005CC09AC|nr:DUF1735 and LamG domain-containing protein [Bacteroides congonensis]